MKRGSNNFQFINHPLLKRDITCIREKSTDHELFRASVTRISTLLAARITESLETETFEVQTPLEKTTGYKLKSEIILVPVLRAGLGMVSGFLSLLPEAKVGHIGIQRNEETLEPKVYYAKVPASIRDAIIIVLDPMLATGGSSAAAIQYLKERGARKIFFASLVSAPEGIDYLSSTHPDVKIYTASLDRCLNVRGYILPGLGDAGDRMFGTL